MKPKRKPKRQGVYIKASTREIGSYKIGITNNDARRSEQIDKSMPGSIHTLFFINTRKAPKIEKRLHEKYRRINAPLSKKYDGHTEWFDPGATLYWPAIGLVFGAIGFLALPYGRSWPALAVALLIGLSGYGILFVLWNILLLCWIRFVELLPIILIFAAAGVWCWHIVGK